MSVFRNSNTVAERPTTTQATIASSQDTARGLDLAHIYNRNLFFDVLLVNVSHFRVSLRDHIFSGNCVIDFQFHTLVQLQQFNDHVFFGVGFYEVVSWVDMQGCFMVGTDLQYNFVYFYG